MSADVIETSLDDPSEVRKVSMGLTLRDIANADALKKRFASRSKAATVSESLEITKTLSDLVMGGGEIYVKDKSGKMQRIIIPCITSER